MSDYNGWTNKETWLVNLWLGDCLQADKEEGVKITADYIESFVDEYIASFNIPTGNLLSDLLTNSYIGINYHELAKHYRE